MAEKQEQFELVEEADKRWNQYKLLQIAVLFSFVLMFIPLLVWVYVVVLLVISISLMIGIMGFLERCGKILD